MNNFNRINIAYPVKILISTLIILVISECLAKYKLNKQGVYYSLFYLQKDKNNKNLSFINKYIGYQGIDPLLGWSLTENQIAERGLKSKDGNIYLENIVPDTKDTLIIFITGGSTSDIALYAYNWPTELYKILKGKNISFRIMIGAVAGYSSSQELLKLIRDGLPIQPTIHISYSGANECENPHFVSVYEQNFYAEILKQSSTSKFFPNLIYFTKQLLHLNKENLELKRPQQESAFTQWTYNMKTMKAIADGSNYKFYGILQPVAGIKKTNNYISGKGTLDHIKQYLDFYPLAESYVTKVNYLSDYTDILSNADEPFLDDCHVKATYQKQIADSIYNLITNDLNLKVYQKINQTSFE